MKKKYLSLGLVAALSLTTITFLTGCGDKNPYESLDLSEYVTVGEYKGLEYSVEEVSVTDEEVETEITSRREAKATTETATTGTVENGNTINISFVGKIDGKEFDGGSAENSDITIGSGNMIDGFESGLIGGEVGGKVTLNLTFPEDYQNEDVAGKDVSFEVTINSKQVENVPEYNVDFVKENSDFDNLADYEADVKSTLLTGKQKKAENTAKTALWKQIVDASEVKKYPEDILNERIKTETDAYKAMAEQYNVSWEDFLSQYMNYTEEEFNAAEKTYAESSVFQEMIMYSIAKTEGIEVTDSEYEKYLKDLLDKAGFTEETFKDSWGQSIEDYAADQDFRTGLLLDKVLQKIMEYGTKTAA